jgi:lipid-A-disaccharide synthase
MTRPVSMTGSRLITSPTVAIVAGETSGDLHAAAVIRALKRRCPDIMVCGAGGNAMAAAGAELIVHSNTLSVMGFSALFAKLPTIFKAMGRLKKLLSSRSPDLLILVDFPDFNLHLAATAKKLGIPVLYYISPTVWAWRAKRIHKIKARVDHMAVILPFEKEIYEKNRIPATFVGHPLLDAQPSTPTRAEVSLENGPIRLALLPGSREGEVIRMLPVMLEAVNILYQDLGPFHVIISRAPSIKTRLFETLTADVNTERIEISDRPVEEIFNRCDFTVITSGTASLEAALAGIPMVIVYATSALNYFLGKRLVDVPHIGLANLIAGKRIVPELIQTEATAGSIARHVGQIVTDPRKYEEMHANLLKVRQLMGKAGGAERVAHIACQLMNMPEK